MSYLVSNLQSMRDRMMAELPKRYGDQFDGDFDIMLEAINELKREPGYGVYISIDRVLSLADVHAEESREDGSRVMSRGALCAFAQDIRRIG